MWLDCFFCNIAMGEQEGDFLVWKDDRTMVFPSRYQRIQNPGHTQVCPVPHIEQLYDIPEDLLGPILGTVQLVARAMKLAWGAEGITIFEMNEPAGGQHVPHVHFHVVPRYTGDQFWEAVGIREHEWVDTPEQLLVEQRQQLAGAMASLRNERAAC